MKEQPQRRFDSLGVLAMLRYPVMYRFSGYTFCPKILEREINF